MEDDVAWLAVRPIDRGAESNKVGNDRVNRVRLATIWL
jgi:hypothetical protein